MGKTMTTVYLIAAFEYDVTLELAITELLQTGISKGQVKAVPLVKGNPNRNKPTLSYLKTDEFSWFDLALIFGNAFAVLFCSLGFIWEWGPIIWAIIGFFTGVLFGVLVRTAIVAIKNGWPPNFRNISKDRTEVLIMIQCPAAKKSQVKEILWNHHALGIAEY
jgi:hypothetical protein